MDSKKNIIAPTIKNNFKHPKIASFRIIPNVLSVKKSEKIK
ncbi:hypothetical protein MGWOODY_Mmi331 [hydrothermal vent metagenome]|uniref:Uncharacterized protein n=1 Tax=hydrothermal vent metagenome TaxID=652676 RepID=A0A160VCX1_9ZZZZ